MPSSAASPTCSWGSDTGSWWGTKSRQALRYLARGVDAADRAALVGWLDGPKLALFDAMHPADQRHGLDVVADLRANGHDDPELLLAGLFHDAAKGRATGLLHRVTWSLGERYGERVISVCAHLPGFASAHARLRDHADASAELALAAGCSERTAELIRRQADPVDPVAGAALRDADERA